MASALGAGHGKNYFPKGEPWNTNARGPNHWSPLRFSGRSGYHAEDW